jgi:hypothetical protein
MLTRNGRIPFSFGNWIAVFADRSSRRGIRCRMPDFHPHSVSEFQPLIVRSRNIQAAHDVWRFRVICLDSFIAIALTAATTATGRIFSDFLIDGMPKFTKVGVHYSCVSIAATGVGARHPSRFIARSGRAGQQPWPPGWEPPGRVGNFSLGVPKSAKKCNE